MVSRHSPQYPKDVISLQARVAAYARNYRETPTEENFNAYVNFKKQFLNAKALHHIALAQMFQDEANAYQGDDLKPVVNV